MPLVLFTQRYLTSQSVIAQWAVFASHNLTENNVENQQYIAGLKMEGLANNQAVLEEMGLAAEIDGEKVVVKKKRRE